ncbi:MAG: SRPBCC family protein [Bacteroidia bacterium]
MNNNTVKGSIKINASSTNIWDVLINPAKIVLYTGSLMQTDWKVGSPITWSGDMHGTKYINKGQVLEVIPEKLLRYTYWSGMGGDQDLPENYSEISYTLNLTDDENILLEYTRINIATEIETQIFEQHIDSMLSEIKKLSEA